VSSSQSSSESHVTPLFISLHQLSHWSSSQTADAFSKLFFDNVFSFYAFRDSFRFPLIWIPGATASLKEILARTARRLFLFFFLLSF